MKKYRQVAAFLTAFVFSASVGVANAAAPFGNPDDVKFAKKLWNVLEKSRLAGKNTITSTPYKGTHPHGAVLDNMDSVIKVGGHKGVVIVKKNFRGKGVSKMAVANDPAKYLKSVTVMFKRENGYDADNKDWFWAKYGPNGKLMKNPKGMPLAGRVAKGMNKGCIACHKAAPGGDLVYLHDRY